MYPVKPGRVRLMLGDLLSSSGRISSPDVTHQYNPIGRISIPTGRTPRHFAPKIQVDHVLHAT